MFFKISYYSQRTFWQHYNNFVSSVDMSFIIIISYNIFSSEFKIDFIQLYV